MCMHVFIFLYNGCEGVLAKVGGHPKTMDNSATGEREREREFIYLKQRNAQKSIDHMNMKRCIVTEYSKIVNFCL